MIALDVPRVIWMPIQDFPDYEINSFGDVQDVKTRMLLPKAKFNNVDYVELMRDGKPYLMHVNRLRWAAFYLPGFPPEETEENIKE